MGKVGDPGMTDLPGSFFSNLLRINDLHQNPARVAYGAKSDIALGAENDVRRTGGPRLDRPGVAKFVVNLLHARGSPPREFGPPTRATAVAPAGLARYDLGVPIHPETLVLCALLGWAVSRHGRCPPEVGRPDHPYDDRGDGVCGFCGSQRCTLCAHACACREHDRRSPTS